MPFQSKSQRRLFHHLKSKGEISPETVKEWEKETPKNKPLPEFKRLKAKLRGK